MFKKILITGISGFVGSHLAEYCLAQNVDVSGIVFSHHLGDEFKRIAHLQDKIDLHECDLTNRIAVSRVLEKVKPDVIFHLAAQSFVPVSWKSPEDTLFNNIMSELNIFEVVRDLGIDPVVQIACSSEEFGLVKENEVPIKETNPFRPLSPYAVSKIAQEMLAYQYHQSYNLKTVLTRCFNIEGPKRGKQFVISSFAFQIAAIEKGLNPIIKVGNLDAFRDFTDVRDTVKALWLAVHKCKYGEPYNIGSGKTHQIKEVLNLLLSFSNVKGIKVEQDPERMRPSDVSILHCDAGKFKAITGWEPTINFEQTVKDTLDYWRNEIK